MEKKRFVMYGAAGFVAPRHMKAIKDNGGELIAAMDLSDSVGVIDSYFPQSEFFTSESEFRKFCKDNKPDYTVICTPNYLHKSQAEFALHTQSTVICEKPVALYLEDLEDLVDVELSTGNRVFTILQLRLNPVLQGLRCEVERDNSYYDVEIQYHTMRGKWYLKSWKGDPDKSGEIQTNIGVHLFDLCQWTWGYVQNIKLHIKTPTRVSGELFLKRAHITFNLSVEDVSTKRSMIIDGKREIEFSAGFQNAHSHSYSKILAGEGFGLLDALPSIILCDRIRKLAVS